MFFFQFFLRDRFCIVAKKLKATRTLLHYNHHTTNTQLNMSTELAIQQLIQRVEALEKQINCKSNKNDLSPISDLNDSILWLSLIHI